MHHEKVLPVCIRLQSDCHRFSRHSILQFLALCGYRGYSPTGINVAVRSRTYPDFHSSFLPLKTVYVPIVVLPLGIHSFNINQRIGTRRWDFAKFLPAGPFSFVSAFRCSSTYRFACPNPQCPNMQQTLGPERNIRGSLPNCSLLTWVVNRPLCYCSWPD